MTNEAIPVPQSDENLPTADAPHQMNRTFENCTLLDTKTWFEKAVKEPTSKNMHTQLGVHFEEVAEMVQEITGNNTVVHLLLANAKKALTELGDYLKKNDGSIHVHPNSEQLFLDAICDQIVTGTGVAHMRGYDIVGAMHEVNRANFSKFGEDGQPIFNEDKKIMRGPNYKIADLSPYLKR